MQVQPLHRYPKQSIDKLLGSVPFYKEVKKKNISQYELLMSYSRIVEYRPGEVLLERGQYDTWLYFLLKGQLAVVVGEHGEDYKVVNYITPGEVFGDLAALTKQKRTATVLVDANCKGALIFGTDFSVFGDLQDHSRVSLSTKLIYYRNTVHSLRWKLEVYRISYPDHAFASNHRKVKLYTGPKDTFTELESLDQQAKVLAKFLVEWNLEFDRLAISPREKLDYKTLLTLDR